MEHRERSSIPSAPVSLSLLQANSSCSGNTNNDSSVLHNSGDVAAGDSIRKNKRARVDAQCTTPTTTTTTTTTTGATVEADGSSNPPPQHQQQQVLSKQRQEEILQVMLCDLLTHDKNKMCLALGTLADFCHEDDNEQQPNNPLAKNAKFIVEHDGIGLIRHILAAATTTTTRSTTEEGDSNNNNASSKEDNVKIIAQGLRALHNLMCHVDDAYHKVHRLGLVEIVLQAMNDHLEYSYLQEVGCCFLNNFIADSTERIKIVANLDVGISTIIQAMDQYPNSLNLQGNACVALSTFCDEKELVGQVFQAGGFSAAARAIEKHNFNPDTNKYAKEAIRALHDYLQFNNNNNDNNNNNNTNNNTGDA